MSPGDKKFYTGFVIVLMIALSVIGVMMYQYSHVWTETGTVTWVGAKVYNDSTGTFAIPYAVTVPIHGTFNFTASGQSGLCGNANSYHIGSTGISGTPSKGTIVALIYLKCGGYDLVVDP